MVGETVGSLGYLPICTLLFEQLIIRPAAARVSSDIEPKWHTTLNFCIHQSTAFMAHLIAYNKPLWIESSIPLVLSRLLQSTTSS
jgi:hypothetical protein